MVESRGRFGDSAERLRGSCGLQGAGRWERHFDTLRGNYIVFESFIGQRKEGGSHVIQSLGFSSKRTSYLDLFLKTIFLILAFWGSSCFGCSNRFFLVFLATTVSGPRFYLYAQSREFLFVYVLPNWGKCARVLSYLVKNSTNKQHQSERVFTMARISAGAVVATSQTKTPSAARHEKRYYIITLDSCF